MSALIFATRNPGKARELEVMLAGTKVVTLDAFPDLVMPEETGATFMDNARIKAHAVAEVADGQPVLADDSGLEVDALDGAPGVRSARWVEGTDDDRNRALLAALRAVPAQGRDARFRCAMCLVAGERMIETQGECEGRIAMSPAGGGGFGYDPVFVLPDGRRMSELSRDEKNRVSHRGTALSTMLPALLDVLKD